MHHILLQEEARPLAIALFDNPSLIFHLGFDQAQLAPGDWFKQTGHPYTQAIGKILDNLITLPYIDKLEFMIADVENPLSHLQAGCDRQIFPKETIPSSICCEQLETQKIYSFIANAL
jgi:3,4-dihydroxy 2-butanone 4-phosphate synthase / GTP cyclohydrolase II